MVYRLEIRRVIETFIQNERIFVEAFIQIQLPFLPFNGLQLFLGSKGSMCELGMEIHSLEWDVDKNMFCVEYYTEDENEEKLSIEQWHEKWVGTFKSEGWKNATAKHWDIDLDPTPSE